MAARPTWKGYIKVSLVTIPVRVYPATESSATISFNQLHADCQTKIQQKKWCPKCEIELTQADIVKGYEFEKGRWVVVEEEDIAKVKTESTKIINLLQFTDVDAIDPMYVDKAYYLAPEGPMAADAYSVMREGMQGKAGIGKVAIHGREYLVAVKPHKQGMVMYTLHHAAEIRTIDQIDELREVRGKVNPAEMKLATAGDRKHRGRSESFGLQGRIPGRAARDHRRQDRRRRDRGAGRSGAAEGRGPDGSAAQEPRSGQLGQEEDGQGRSGAAAKKVTNIKARAPRTQGVEDSARRHRRDNDGEKSCLGQLRSEPKQSSRKNTPVSPSRWPSDR